MHRYSGRAPEVEDTEALEQEARQAEEAAGEEAEEAGGGLLEPGCRRAGRFCSFW